MLRRRREVEAQKRGGPPRWGTEGGRKGGEIRKGEEEEKGSLAMMLPSSSP